jgi:hypothetical protein
VSEPYPPPPDDLSAALAALRPHPVALDRDALMFRAGQAAAVGRCRPWQWGAGVMTGISVCLTIALMTIREPEPSIRVVHVAEPLRPVQASAEEAPVVSPRAAEEPNVVSRRLEKAFLQASLPPTYQGEQAFAGPTPVTAWHWRNDVLMHPSLLDEDIN